jgi:NADH dehydrogenase (ubiquinone) Fe-S protein 6
MAATDPDTPEIAYTDSARVACDGATEMNQVRLAPQAAVRSGGPDDPGSSPALGHPRVWLQIDEKGYVDCGYCDKRFILRGGPADEGASGA